MDFYRELVVAWAIGLLSGFCDAFNIDTKRPRIIPGSKEAYFGYTVQQHEINGKKWLVVGAPYETSGQQKTGDVYKCSVNGETNSTCSKLNLGRVTLSNVSERKDNMRLGLSLTTNPKDNSFLVRNDLHVGLQMLSELLPSSVVTSLRFMFNPRCQTYMDIIIVLDGSNSIYPWVEVQNFLISILEKFYIGPGQIQVGVVQYGEDAVHEFHLNDYRSVKDVVEAARHIEQRGGTETRTAFGIEFARTEAFQKGGRKGAKKVMIVITDGESHDSPDLEKVIEGSEKDNVTRYAVAVLGYYNRRGINPEAFLKEIKYIASDPDEKHFFNVTDEAALKDIVDALGERIFSLEGTNKHEISFGLEMSQTGFSSHIVEDGILLGAVGAYDWNGAVLKETSSGKVVPHRESYLQEFPEELKNHGAYLGYTVTSVVSTRLDRIYVAGAPRFNHTGKVIIFTMHTNRNLTIHQSLKGEQIGAYYGSEINSVDINGDGVTDVLLVGAPMYFSEGRERGKVYVYTLKEGRFVSNGTLEDLPGYQNSRFGSCIAAVSDLNQDSYNDVVVGAPLEDEQQGAIYIFHGYKENLVRQYKQRITAAEISPGLMYFGCSIHGNLDLNEDRLVDLAVGSLGNAVLLWSRSVVRINASLRFEPFKINIFNKDCTRNGKDATCLSAFLCFTAIFLSAHFQTASVTLNYNITIDERRYIPRAHLDENGDRLTHKTVTLFAGQEWCDKLNFHVLDTADYVKPVTFSVDYALGSTLGIDRLPPGRLWGVSFMCSCREGGRFFLGCCFNVCSFHREYCRRVLRKSHSDCSAYTLSFDTSIFVIESARRRVAVEATLENRGENAYNTVLNISFSRNLKFASLIQKDDLDINIECVSEEKHPNRRVCNVSYPFFRAKAKVAFRLDFEFSKSIFLQNLEISLTANSDSEEQENTKDDNSALLKFPLKYETDLLFTRSPSQNYYEVKSNNSLERYDSIGPPFNCTFKLQNLGLFPVDAMAIKITVPVATRGGNRLLQLAGFHVDEEHITCHIGGNNTDYRRTPSDEDLGRHPQLNYSNSDVISIDCSVNLAANGEVSFLLHGNLWMKSLRAMKFKSLRFVINAVLQRGFRSAFVFREDDPSRQVSTVQFPQMTHHAAFLWVSGWFWPV
uniref:Integrin subunit alpha 11 n=1 Tax=Podarcis muralis TaxID=64176 RepID=A0A670JHX3_PODMU